MILQDETIRFRDPFMKEEGTVRIRVKSQEIAISLWSESEEYPVELFFSPEDGRILHNSLNQAISTQEMRLEPLATQEVRDLDTLKEAYVIIRASTQVVALCFASRQKGDVEIFLPVEACRVLYESLDKALLLANEKSNQAEGEGFTPAKPNKKLSEKKAGIWQTLYKKLKNLTSNSES